MKIWHFIIPYFSERKQIFINNKFILFITFTLNKKAKIQAKKPLEILRFFGKKEKGLGKVKKNNKNRKIFLENRGEKSVSICYNGLGYIQNLGF